MKMEFQKIVNFLDITSDNKDLPRFVTKKWIDIYDQSEGNFNLNQEITIKTSMLRFDLCDFNDAYIVVKGNITVTNPDDAKKIKEVTFKNNAPFINCILKVNGVKIDNAEDLDIVMPMYNLLEYSKNYKKNNQVVYGIIIEMKEVIVFLLILNLLNIKQVLQETLIILMKKLQMMMVMKLIILNMMQIKLVKMKLKLLFH